MGHPPPGREQNLPFRISNMVLDGSGHARIIPTEWTERVSLDVIMMKRIPHGLLALGRSNPPPRIHIDGHTYELHRCLKHDFFACTSIYHGEAGKIILKLNRQADLMGLPGEWIGRLLAHHENGCLQDASGLDSVPKSLGRWGPTGVVHAYIEGRHLDRGLAVPDDFFLRLSEALQALHNRNMAYVDLEKPQNVILGDDGRPYLIDFQISWRWPFAGGESRWVRWMRRKLQESDRYHLLKLRRRFRPDQLSEDEIRRSYEKPKWVRWHSRFTAPLQKFRRRTLNRIDPKRRQVERGAIIR